MIAPPWLVAGEGVGRDISFNVEGTSLSRRRAHPARQQTVGRRVSHEPAQHPLRHGGCWVLWSSRAKPSLCSLGGWQLGRGLGSPHPCPHDCGKGVVPVEGMRLPGPVQSSLPPQMFPLCSGCFGGGGVVFPCGHGPTSSVLPGPVPKARAASKVHLLSLSPCLG